MKVVFLKKQMDKLVDFMESEAGELGIAGDDLEKIEVATSANIQFTFPGHTSQLELIRRMTKEVAAYLPFTEADLEDIGLAIDEACTNVIHHSYAGIKGVIMVEYKLDPKKLTIVLMDEGEKGQNFNPDLLDPVDKEEYLKILSKGGLGVHLIRKIMDEVEYSVVPGVKNSLVMIKYVKN